MCNNLIKKGFKEHKSGLWVSRDGEVYVPKSGRNNEHYTYGSTMNNGYLYVKINRKQYLVHRLVAECFIPNTNNYPQINHKDENKANNCVENLEWCTCKYNNNYGKHNERMAKALSKTVNQYTLDGKLVKTWASTMDIQRSLGFSTGNIISCCKGRLKTSYKYIWKYA